MAEPMADMDKFEGAGNRHGNLRRTVADERLRCICPGTASRRPRCKDEASQEDGQCDPCREHCAPAIARAVV